MLVIYRLCNIKSPTSVPPPILKEDQFELNSMCLNSFMVAFAYVNPKVIFICDFCPKDLYDPILDSVPFEKIILYTEKGINSTMLMAYEIAKQEKDETILFQECDYLFLPQSGEKIKSAINHFGLFSPYDHKNFYLDPSIHSSKIDIELYEDHHFRTTERNTMTFGMTREVFGKNLEILNRYGYLDNEVWKEIRVNGNKLWTPIPSFATHMVEGMLSPGIDWETLWTFYGKPKPQTV